MHPVVRTTAPGLQAHDKHGIGTCLGVLWLVTAVVSSRAPGSSSSAGEICSALIRLNCGQEGHRHRPSTYVQACIMTAALMDSERAR